MTVQEVIKLRDALRAGHNYPLRINISGNSNPLDESMAMERIIWDDANGVIYCFRMIDPQMDHLPSNHAQAITLVAVDYIAIESMEVVVLPIKDLDDMFDSIETYAGSSINEFTKTSIKELFHGILNPDLVNLTRTDLDRIDGPDIINDADDYYNNVYVEPFRETVRYRKRNEEIEESTTENP